MSLWPSVEMYRLAREAKQVPRIHHDVSYGVFLGGDPRNFSPDPECSDEQERDAHRKACENAGPLGADYCMTMQALGAPRGPGFGLGTNSLEYPCEGNRCEACVYLGEPDQRLSPEQWAALREVKRLAGLRKAERRRARS